MKLDVGEEDVYIERDVNHQKYRKNERNKTINENRHKFDIWKIKHQQNQINHRKEIYETFQGNNSAVVN